MQKKLPILFFSLYLLAMTAQSALAAGIAINLVVINPSSDQTKQTPVTYFLPKEIDAEDIINTGGLDLDYDIDKSAYYLHGTIELKPKESRTIKVEVKDVWRVTPDEIDMLKKQIDDNLALLQKTLYRDSGQMLRDRMFEKLDYILTQQKNYSENIERRIEEYRAYANELAQIRKNAFSTDYLKTSPSIANETKTVKFVIEVKNPSAKELKAVKQQHYLPKEIRSEHVVDSQGFDVRFDEKKQQSFLAREEEFKPGETKRYEIAIKDIWNISEDNLETLRKNSQAAFDGVKGSEYESSAQYLIDSITGYLDEIEKTQKEKQDMKKYIGTYRTNQKHYDQIQDDILKLERMLATVKAKKLEEFESSKVKNILQKMQALRGIMAISQAVFGKKPTMNTTWRVIWGILIFVAFFTAIHFFTWWSKARVMGEEFAAKTGGKITEVNKDEAAVENKK